MQRPSLTPLILCAAILCSCESEAHRVAIIGGGISGTFAAKYLAEYDAHHRHHPDDGDGSEERDCLLDEIVVYDVSPPPPSFAPGGTDEAEGTSSASKEPLQSSADPRPADWQGSRVASVTLNDGKVVELGASIIYDGNQLVVEMMNADPERLKRIQPMSTGRINKQKDGDTKKQKPRNGPSGFGIYHGEKQWLLKPSPFVNFPSFLKKILDPLLLLWRYNFDFFRLKGAVNTAVHSFGLIYDVLNDTQHDVTYFESPMELWEAMGLGKLAGVSFHDFLDGLGLYRDASLELSKGDGGSGVEAGTTWWDWRKWLPGMGCMRSELVTAMTINTYNQDLSQMNGLVGLVAYVPVGGELFSVEGGNHKLMESALLQAKELYDSSSCKNSELQRVQRIQSIITSVVASEGSMELFEDQKSLGKYDTVILAAPLQQSRVRFLVESPMGLDGAVLHEIVRVVVPQPLGK